MARVGRPPSCLCGECSKCKARIYARAQYQALSVEERRALIARRNPEAVKANRRAQYLKHRDAHQAAASRWRAENPEKVRASHAAWVTRNREKRRAHWRVQDAIKSGRLVQRACEVCGDANSHAHHDDYSRPLDVLWLCPSHHGERHRVLNEAKRARQGEAAEAARGGRHGRRIHGGAR